MNKKQQETNPSSSNNTNGDFPTPKDSTPSTSAEVSTFDWLSQKQTKT